MSYSRLGVHVVLGPRNGYGAFLNSLRIANRPVLIKCVDDFGAAYEVKRVYPTIHSLTVGRVNSVKDPVTGDTVDLQGLNSFAEAGAVPAQVAEWYLNLVRPVWSKNPWIEVWETLNEWSAHWEWQADFNLAFMEIAQDEGYKLAAWACSSGNPPETAWPSILKVGRFAKQYGHYLSMHEYGGVGENAPSTLEGIEPWHALRYRSLYQNSLIPGGGDAPLIISGCGQNAGYQFIGTQDFIADAAWYDSEIARDSYVIGAALWTLGNWAQANFQDALPELARYMTTVILPDPIPPTPPKRLGDARVPYNRKYYRVNQKATLAQWLESCELAYQTRSTVGFSNDDAGIGVGLSKREITEVGGEFTPEVIEPWYLKEYGVSPENVDHIPYPGTPTPPPVDPFKLASPVPSIPLVITDPFNAPRNYANGKHEGVDLRAVNSAGQPVDICACADGVVVTDMDVIGGNYGITVVLEHRWPDGNVYRTWYAHLTRNYVTLGQSVKKGQPIGLAGASGTAAIHLHLNLQRPGHGLSGYAVPDVVDPTSYLPPVNTPPPPTGKFTGLVGLHHDSTGGAVKSVEVDLLKAAGFWGNPKSCFKLWKPEMPQAWEVVNGNGAGIPYSRQFVRLAAKTDARMPPHAYINGPEGGLWGLGLHEAFGIGADGVELGNEPQVEGMGVAWTSPEDFCLNHLKPVAQLIHQYYDARYPGRVRLVTPGLSPSFDPIRWWTAMRDTGTLPLFFAIGAHSYWQSVSGPFPMEVAGRDYRKAIPFLQFLNNGRGGQIWITEASNNGTLSTDQQKGQEYAEWASRLESDRVHCAIFFISIGSPEFEQSRETWARWNGLSHSITAIPSSFKARWGQL